MEKIRQTDWVSCRGVKPVAADVPLVVAVRGVDGPPGHYEVDAVVVAGNQVVGRARRSGRASAVPTGTDAEVVQALLLDADSAALEAVSAALEQAQPRIAVVIRKAFD